MSSSSSLQSSLEEVRDDNKFNDVTLASEDGQLVEAHKVILAGCSPQTNTPTLLSELTGSSCDVENVLRTPTDCFIMGSIWCRKHRKLFTKREHFLVENCLSAGCTIGFKGILHRKIDNGTPHPQIRDFMGGGGGHPQG